MKNFKDKIAYFLLGSILGLGLLAAGVSGAAVCQGWQGCTGIATSTNVGGVVTVSQGSTTSSLQYSITTAGSGIGNVVVTAASVLANNFPFFITAGSSTLSASSGLSNLTGGGVNASGTWIVKGTSSLQSVSSTNQNISGYLGVGGQSSLASVSSTNLESSGRLAVAAQSGLASVSSTNLQASGQLIAGGQASLSSVSSTNLQSTGQLVVGGQSTLASVSTTNITANGFITLTGAMTGAGALFTGQVAADKVNATTSVITPSSTVSTSFTLPINNSTTLGPGQIHISNNTGTLEYGAGGGTALALTPTSSLSFAAVSSSFTGDDFVWIANGNYKFTNIQAVNKLAGDSCGFNFQWAANRASTTAQGASSLFTATTTVTASTSTVDIAITGSTTIKYGNILRLVSAPLTSNECDITLSLQIQL